MGNQEGDEWDGETDGNAEDDYHFYLAQYNQEEQMNENSQCMPMQYMDDNEREEGEANEQPSSLSFNEEVVYQELNPNDLEVLKETSTMYRHAKCFYPNDFHLSHQSPIYTHNSPSGNLKQHLSNRGSRRGIGRRGMNVKQAYLNHRTKSDLSSSVGKNQSESTQATEVTGATQAPLLLNEQELLSPYKLILNHYICYSLESL